MENYLNDLIDTIHIKTKIPKATIRLIIQEIDPLEMIMGTVEASDFWAYSQSSVKDMCSNKEVKAKKLNKEWAITKFQDKPTRQRKKKKEEN